jgi:hypothetical protein
MLVTTYQQPPLKNPDSRHDYGKGGKTRTSVIEEYA